MTNIEQPSKSIYLYDTTLRDGAQAAGVSFTLKGKLEALGILDKLGIHYIEGGWPGANSIDTEFFGIAQGMPLTARLAAFGSTRRVGIEPEDDLILQALMDSRAPVCTLVGKSSLLHVEKVLRTTPEENLSMIFDSVNYLKTQGREVGFDAEHFFDGYKNNPGYALETLRAAIEGGVNWIALCDTNGGSSMNTLRAIIKTITKDQSITVPLGIHTHNDRGFADANTLIAVGEGIQQIQGTVNAYGERTGNANILTIIANFAEEGVYLLPQEQLIKLTSVSRRFEQLTGCPASLYAPYVGQHAYDHKAGYHGDGVLKLPSTYEHIPPETFGNRRSFRISELGGTATMLANIENLRLPYLTDRAFARQVADKVKELASRGFLYDTGSASFEILVRRLHPDYHPPIDLEMQTKDQSAPINVLHIYNQTQPEGKCIDIILTPPTEDIRDIFQAFKGSLVPYYPFLSRISLVSRRIQAINGHAKRVFVELSDGEKSWTAVYVNHDDLHSYWNALKDAMEYAILHQPVLPAIPV